MRAGDRQAGEDDGGDAEIRLRSLRGYEGCGVLRNLSKLRNLRNPET